MYQVEWLLENYIILFRGRGNQTAETIKQGADHLSDLFDAGEYPVQLIIDNRYIGTYPKNIATIKKLMSKHPNSGEVIIVGGKTTDKFITSMLAQLTGSKKPKFCNTVSDAVAMLKRLDARLPDMIDFDEYPVEETV